MINNILEEELTALEKQILNGFKKPCQSQIIGQWHCILDDYPPFNVLVDVANISKERFKNAFLEKSTVCGGKLIWNFSKYDTPNKDTFKFFNSFYNTIVYWCFLPEVPSIFERFE